MNNLERIYIVSSVYNKKIKLLCPDTGSIVDSFIKKNVKNLNEDKSIFVGDVVHVLNIENDFVIYKINKRHNVVLRKDSNRSNRSSTIAVNVDIIIIVASPIEPYIKPEFIYRCMLTANILGIKFYLIINKIDKLSDPRMDRKRRSIYMSFLRDIKNSSIEYFEISMKDCVNIDKVAGKLKNKKFILLGQSGVGKSTIISYLCNLKLKTNANNMHGLGKHTTTNACAYKSMFGGICIDTPGIKSMEIFQSTYNNDLVQIAKNFPEISKYYGKCKYNDCIHDNANDINCAVANAVNHKVLSAGIFAAYLNVLKTS